MIRNWYNQIPYPALKTVRELNWNPSQLWFFSSKLLESKKISNDQERIQSDPISCPQNHHGALKSCYDWHNVENNENCYSKHKSVQAEVHVQSLIFLHCFIWINFVSAKVRGYVICCECGKRNAIYSTWHMQNEWWALARIKEWPGSKRSCCTHVGTLQWR